MAKRVDETPKEDKPFKWLIAHSDDARLLYLLRQEGYDYTLLESDNYNGVLFGGTGPVSPILYGEAPIFSASAPQPNYMRDRREWRLLRRLPRHIPKVGFGRGAHLLNAFNGGGSLQDVSGHAGIQTREHKLKVWGKDEFTVFSEHTQMLVPGEGAEIVALAQKSHLKRSYMYTRTYTREQRQKDWDDPEALLYWYHNCFCFEPNPCEPHDETQALFCLLTKDFIEGKFDG